MNFMGCLFIKGTLLSLDCQQVLLILMVRGEYTQALTGVLSPAGGSDTEPLGGLV